MLRSLTGSDGHGWGRSPQPLPTVHANNGDPIVGQDEVGGVVFECDPLLEVHFVHVKLVMHDGQLSLASTAYALEWRNSLLVDHPRPRVPRGVVDEDRCVR